MIPFFLILNQHILVLVVLMEFQDGTEVTPRGIPSARVQTEVHVHVFEEFDEPRQHHHYRQSFPAQYRVLVEGSQGSANTSLSYSSECRWKPQEPVYFLSSALTPRLSLSLAGEMPRITVSSEFLKSTSEGGRPRSDPPISKSGLSGEGVDPVEDSDRSVLYGPTLNVPVKDDVTEWGLASWLPRRSELSFYARALFGEFEVFESVSDIEMYSIGLLLQVPFLGDRSTALQLSWFFSSGPAWMHTDLGDATGVDGSTGLGVQLSLSRSTSLVMIGGGAVYVTEDLFSWGPVLTLGTHLSW